MPNCDFYAMGSDHRMILEYLLATDECDVFELSSQPGREVIRFQTLADFEAAYGFEDWSATPPHMLLQLHVRNAGGCVRHRRIDYVNVSPSEEGFCFKTEGWGLIQLYLEAPRKNSLRASHTNHNSKARAETWSSTIQRNGSPDSWDWSKITSFSRRLNGFIRKHAVAKVGSRVILPEAHAKQMEGAWSPLA